MKMIYSFIIRLEFGHSLLHGGSFTQALLQFPLPPILSPFLGVWRRSATPLAHNLPLRIKRVCIGQDRTMMVIIIKLIFSIEIEGDENKRSGCEGMYRTWYGLQPKINSFGKWRGCALVDWMAMAGYPPILGMVKSTHLVPTTLCRVIIQ